MKHAPSIVAALIAVLAGVCASWIQSGGGAGAIAAATGLASLGRSTDAALAVLVEHMTHADGWVRLRAALALDELDETARPAIPALRDGLKDQPNRYVIRVANRALNELEGADDDVP